MIFFLTCFACLKQYTITGNIKDKRGRSVENVIIEINSNTVPKKYEFWKKSINVSTRSDKRGKFTIMDGFRKNESYQVRVLPLAHKDISEELLLENEPFIKLRFTLHLRDLTLPYRPVNLNTAVQLNKESDEETQAPDDGKSPTEDSTQSSPEENNDEKQVEANGDKPEESTEEDSTEEETEETEEEDEQ